MKGPEGGPLSDEGREIRICESAAALTREAARVFVTAVEEACARRGRCAVALSGGSTPRALYRLLGDPTAPYRATLPWRALHLFWGDERHVGPEHADSNFRMVRETLLRSVPLPDGNVHRIAAELADADQAAARYEAELQAFFGLEPGEAPRFDLVLLGLGDDGHTASLFPGSEAVREMERLVVAPYVAAHNGYRITLTPKVLDAARQAAFLVSGAAKAPAVHAILAGPRDPLLHPAQVVGAERILWLVDRAAAAQLPS